MPKGNGTTFDYSDPVTNTFGQFAAANCPASYICVKYTICNCTFDVGANSYIGCAMYMFYAFATVTVNWQTAAYASLPYSQCKRAKFRFGI